MKMPKLLPFRRVFHSVFTKLLLISLATWFLILISVLVTFIIKRHSPEDPFYKNANLYIQYLMDDLGSPPDPDKAMVMHNTTGIHISFIGQGKSWSTRGAFPEIEKIRFHRLNKRSELQIGRKFGAHFLLMQTEDGLLYFEFTGADEEDKHHQLAHLLLLLLISMALLICYLSIKHVLLPLRWLRNGVQEVLAGNLAHQVPTRGSDELSELGSSFNQMTSKLKQMLQTKEYLLRDISHELRSPLTRMKVALEFIEKKDLKDDIEQDIHEMEEMIAAILQSAKEHHESMQKTLVSCNVAGVVQQSVNKFGKIPPGAEFFSEVKEAFCMADAQALQTVIKNCIENGLKFSHQDGKPLQVHLAVTKMNAVITIRDFGMGIEENDLSYVFEPFYRIDSSRSRKSGGFGLGLSICKSIIEGHGGTIQVSSRVNHGTRITISLPLNSSSAV